MANTNDGSSLGGMKLIIGAVATLAVAALAYFLFMGSSVDGTKTAEETKNSQLAENVMGSADAPVTIIEYSNLTCSHCATFHKETLPGLKEKYIDTGKVKYILREFPGNALASAGFMLGRCLPKRESYFIFIDMLYARQAEWAFVKDPGAALQTLAKQAGFTDESFKKCVDDKELAAKILAVRNTGSEEFRISSTPTFFVNGARLEGAQPLEEFQKLIDPLIK